MNPNVPTHDPRDPREQRLLRMLAAAQAPADGAILARARARIAAEGAAPAWLRWLGSPAAVFATAALCIACGVTSVELMRGVATSSTSTEGTTLVSTLLGDDGNDGLPSAAAASGSMSTHVSGVASVSDSGGGRP